ncbi:MAG TPA: divergent polysaccharide deacetylase family protein, partial [Acetobacteraceae bacterium]|nr:divergent polysaccharide deacetylase family protein [Acetobacteraceae bacterium]
AALERLEEVARDRGAALGLVSLPRPVTLDRLAAWTATLSRRGLALAPVSAIVQPPPAPPAAPARADAEE